MALNFTVVSTFQFALQQIINKQLCQRNCQGNISLATSPSSFLYLTEEKGEATLLFLPSRSLLFPRQSVIYGILYKVSHELKAGISSLWSFRKSDEAEKKSFKTTPQAFNSVRGSTQSDYISISDRNTS